MHAKSIFVLIFCIIAAIFVTTGAMQGSYIEAGIALGLALLCFINHFDKIALFGALTMRFASLLAPLPGQPFFWELFAILGFVGLVINLMNNPTRFIQRCSRYWFTVVIVVAYGAFLFLQMRLHDVGFMAIGGSTTGGRSYLNQMWMVSVPLLAIVVDIKRVEIKYLAYIAALVTGTFLVSDIYASYFLPGANIVFLFLSPPYDTLAYASAYESGSTDLVRLQSLNHIATGILLFATTFFLSRRKSTMSNVLYFLCFVIAILLATGGGSRATLVVITLIFAGAMYIRKRISVSMVIAGVLGCVFLIIGAYAFTDKLPYAAQRALSFLPDIQVEDFVRQDAYYTAIEREELRKTGLSMISEHFWQGSGLGVSDDYEQLIATSTDSHELHVARKAFLNGPISVFVTSGIFGFLLVMALLCVVVNHVYKCIKLIRSDTQNYVNYSVCAFFASFAIANLLRWMFVTGNAHSVMVVFGTMLGWMIASKRAGLDEAEASREVISQTS